MNTQEGLWGSPELAGLLQVPERTLAQWAYRKVGPPYVKVGRHRRYRPEDVQAWLDRQTQRTTDGTQGGGIR